MRRTLLLLLIAVPLSGVGRLGAEEPATTTAPPATTTTLALGEEPADTGFTSPQSTIRGFLLAARAADWTKAAEHLDLRRVSKQQRAAVGPRLARQLKIVLDRTLWIDLETLSADPDGERGDGLAARRDLVGSFRTRRGPTDVLVERVPLSEGGLGWKVAGSTVAEIAELYAEFGDGPLADLLPAALLDVSFLELRLWQWLALPLLVTAGLLLGWLATGSVLRLVGMLARTDEGPASQQRVAALAGPFRLLIALLVVTAGLRWLALSVAAAYALDLVRKTIGIVAITWLWLRVVDVVAGIAAERLQVHGRAGGVSMIPLARRTTKVFVATIAIVAIVQNLGYDATGILAGLGVGGLALALAAQKTVENLFGGMMLVADQPVRVGDLCRFGNRTGVVEDIGLRSTRIRTPERTVVSVPNAEFATTQIENLALRDRMLLTTKLLLRVDTDAERMRAVLSGVRNLLALTAKIDHGSTSVRLVGLGGTSIEVEVTAYVLTRDWQEFLSIREDVFLGILAQLGAAGAELVGTPPPPPA